MWQYVGYWQPNSIAERGYGYSRYYWSNAAGGGNDIAVIMQKDLVNDITNVPPAEADIYYGELDEYNGDIIAYMDANNIIRDSI